MPPTVLESQLLATVTGNEGPPPTSYLDATAPGGARLAYYVIAQYPQGPVLNPFSGLSNFATVATPVPALMLAFITEPTSTQAGQTMSVVRVAIQSASGGLVSLSGVPITLGFGTNPSGASLAGTTTQNTVEGVAAFNNLSINNVGTGYTLVASAPGAIVATSTPFNITAGSPLSIVTASVPDATLGAPYSQTLAAQGGVAPFTWTIDTIAGESGSQFVLPAGLTLTTQANGTGLISGTPTPDEVNPRTFRVRVTDSSGQTATQDLCIFVGESAGGTLAATPLPGELTPPLQSQVEALAQLLAGDDVSISNVTYTGVARAVGSFDGGLGATGLSSGIILSSGAVGNVNGTNTQTGITASNLTPGDTDLTGLAGSPTNDAAVLQFDFVVTNSEATTVKFDYVFASEEYNEFVGSGFNDAFAFFISGPGFPTPRNVALVPNTNIPVTINNVNLGNNATQYVNNSPGVPPLVTQADGLTKVFSISADITPGFTYHLKIAIADAGDRSLDSWVMLKAGSFGAVCPVIPECPTCGQN